MIYKRHIYGNLEENQINTLKKNGIFVDDNKESFVIAENETYNKLKKTFEEWGVIDWRFVVFDNDEILDAEYCIFENVFSPLGYPMPDKNFGYRELSFNLDNYCEKCGSNKKQNSEIRLKKLPKKFKLFHGIQWEYDVIFVKKSYYEEVFKPLGINYFKVLLYKSNIEVEEIVQLDIPVIDEDLNFINWKYESCSVCNTKKYDPNVLTFYPMHKKPLKHIYRTKEFFGSGRSAVHKIFIHKDLRDRLIADKIIDIQSFIPAK